jgi:hypothetical protein
MPNPNAIVSTTIRFEPPIDQPPEEMLRVDGGVSVQLEGERRARLDPADPRPVGFVRVLEGLSNQRMPVYIEIDPSTETITLLLVPHVARVINITSTVGALDVEPDASHARHVLPREGLDAA